MTFLSRIASIALLSVSLTSCNTLNGLKNTLPVRLLDELGTEALSLISENDLPAGSRPATVQDRARRIENRGIYAGHAPVFIGSPRQSMVSR